ncbi:MAG: NAD(P)-dependent oxidoreductase [Clostridia bacterium]|nr:NAD(P)-dependent oxidoreductase [Clostridia bacterium]MDD4048286.1 NAD(P)-dependent oxidoreductase [Clostridia bacterium]
MKKIASLVTADYSEKGINDLKEFLDVEYNNWQDQKKPFSQEELKGMVQGKEILVVEMTEVHKEVIDANPQLKIIACCRGLRGDDPTIDIPTCNERNIPVLLAPGRNLNSVAEFTLLLTLNIMRKVRPAINWFYNSEWKEWLDFYTTFRTGEIQGRTVGLMGFGNIGKRVAKLFNAFGAKVIAYDPFITDLNVFKENNAEKVDAETLFKTADIVSLHMNVNEDTKGFINEKLIGLMKPTAFLINSARAAIVDRDALYNALKDKKIAGYATDVYHAEPCNPEIEPMLNFDNFFGTPHLGGTAVEVVANHSEMVVNDLKRLLNGEKPKFIVNPEVLPAFQEVLKTMK